MDAAAYQRAFDRKQLAILCANYDGQISSLDVENAKLRGLVRTMAYCMQAGRDCDGCWLNGADGAITEPAGCDELRELMMRELGGGGGRGGMMVTRCKFVHNLKCEEVSRHIHELHELVEDMLDYIEIQEAFGRPPTSEMCKKFAQRADKLGIEVDE